MTAEADGGSDRGARLPDCPLPGTSENNSIGTRIRPLIRGADIVLRRDIENSPRAFLTLRLQVERVHF